MTILSRLVGAYGKLPPAETHNILIERDLPVPMPDGAILLANRYAPRGVEKPPLILVRSCYGRTGLVSLLYGRIFAERGFQVLIQSTRGTFGSGGPFEPLVHERDDGLATVEWLKQQPWFPGSFGTMGLSYLGFVQWAIARDVGPELKAMAIQVSSPEFRNAIYSGESFSLEIVLTWIHLVAHQEHTSSKLNYFSIRESLAWLQSHLREDRSQLREAPVRVFVTGANEWRDLSDWPPPGSIQQRWHFQPSKALSSGV